MLLRFFGRINSTKTILYLGQFGALALMVTLLIFNITLMESAKQRINTVVFDHNEKIELIFDMRTAARERTVSLQKMLILEDPIDVSEEMFDFTNYASDFLSARAALLKLNLSNTERQLLEEYMVFVRQNGSLQKKVTRLILAGDYDEARETLLSKVIPLQDTIFDKMSKIIAIQKSATRKALAEGEAEYTTAMNIIIIAGVMTILIVIYIVYSITRHISNAEKIIYSEKERAHTTLYSIGGCGHAQRPDAEGNIHP